VDVLYQAQIIEECGAVGGMIIGRGKEVIVEYLPQCHIVLNGTNMA
jgi:hypothetical protein